MFLYSAIKNIELNDKSCYTSYFIIRIREFFFQQQTETKISNKATTIFPYSVEHKQSIKLYSSSLFPSIEFISLYQTIQANSSTIPPLSLLSSLRPWQRTNRDTYIYFSLGNSQLPVTTSRARPSKAGCRKKKKVYHILSLE